MAIGRSSRSSPFLSHADISKHMREITVVRNNLMQSRDAAMIDDVFMSKLLKQLKAACFDVDERDLALSDRQKSTEWSIEAVGWHSLYKSDPSKMTWQILR